MQSTTSLCQELVRASHTYRGERQYQRTRKRLRRRARAGDQQAKMYLRYYHG